MSIFDKLPLGKLKDLGALIAKKGAPLLASAVTGGAAGPILGIVAEALGVESDDPDALEKAIANNPEAALKLKEIQSQQKVELQKLAVEAARIRLEEDKAYLGDAQSARQREVAVTQAIGKRDIHLYILAWLVVGGFFVLLGILMKVTLPTGATGYVNQLFGALATGFGMVLSYFFGSSKGSADKTAWFSNELKNKEEAASQNTFPEAKG